MALKPFYNKKHHLGKDPDIIKGFFAPVPLEHVPVVAKSYTGRLITKNVNYIDNDCVNVSIPDINIYGIPSEIQYKIYEPVNIPPQTIVPNQEQVLTLFSNGYLEVSSSENPGTYQYPQSGQKVIIDLGVFKIYLSRVDEYALYKGVNNLPAVPAYSFPGGLYESTIDYTTENIAKFYFTKIV